MPRISAAFLTLLVILASGCTTLKTPVFATDDGAIRGYDPVAYHLVGAPTRGLQNYQSSYNGENWNFFGGFVYEHES